MSIFSNFFSGSPEIRKQVSTLRPEQEPLYRQLTNSGMRRGAGGAFGGAADQYRDILEGRPGQGALGRSQNYYNNLLSDDSEDYQAFANPAMRQYREEIMPSLSEQFAGMGAGGLSSSGFQNAQTQGAVDLSERLGQIRANLRQAGAQGLQNLGQFSTQGLQNLGQQGLNQYSQNMTTQEGSPGFLSQLAPAAGTAIGAYFGGPAGASAGASAGNWFSGLFGNKSGNRVGANTSPYGQNMPQSSPRVPLPSFGQGARYNNRGY
jgi:hypothetical protein